MYNITVRDQYSPAVVTVPANMLSIEISRLSDNGTSIITNREYTVTVSAISDQGMSYPSDPIVVSKLHTGVPTHICIIVTEMYIRTVDTITLVNILYAYYLQLCI